VTEELVVLITPCPLCLTIIDCKVFQASALAKKQLEIQNKKGGQELYESWCIKSQLLIIFL